MKTDIYIEGWNARMNGEDAQSNPYLADHSIEQMAQEWLNGYLDAKSHQYVLAYSN